MRRIVVAVLAAGLGVACAPRPAPSGVGVVATVAPLAFLASALGGERIEVGVLVPGGASPHAFEPRPSDVLRLARARTLLRVGSGLDDWTDALVAGAAGSLEPWTATAVPGILDAPEPGEPPDPHVWLDPVRVRDRLAPALAAHLAGLDPTDAAGYANRLQELSLRLTALDDEIDAMLRRASGRSYVALHPGWHYFATRYGLHEVGIVHGPALEEPTPRSLARLVDRARRERPGVLLLEPQLDPRLGTLIARELGTRTLLVDPLGDASDASASGYETLLRTAARAFAGGEEAR